MKNNFEETLPEGYKEVYHINAKSVKFGLIMNLLALVPLILLALAAVLIAVFTGLSISDNLLVLELELLGFVLLMIIYIVAHELVHGIVYKSMTRRRLTFGLSWSCAFCGVPDIYCYRRTALAALIMPFIVFTLLFSGLTAAMYFVDLIAFVLSAALLGLHIGGCGGDLFMFGLLIFKYRDKTLLVRDTGPEQFLYLKEENQF